MKEDLRRHIIATSASVREALVALNALSGGSMTLLPLTATTVWRGVSPTAT